MFNRLIIVVLTLGLLLTFSSAAISSDNVPKHGLNPYETTNPSAPRYQDISIIEQETPAFHKPPGSLSELATPTAVLPPQYFCDFIDYSGGAAAYFWRIPDIYGDVEMGMRFTPAEGYNCTLLATYIGVYGSYLGANPGTPDMLVTVYADDGFGLPGTNLGSVVIPNASLPTSGLAYVPVDLTSLGPLVFVDGEEFHVGVSVNNFADPDTLAILSDDGSAGLERSWEDWQGYYGLMIDDWGIDINFLIGVDLCCDRIPFTDCYTQEYNCGVAYFWPQPDAYGDDYFNMRFSVGGPETLMAVGVALYGPPTTGAPDMDVFVWGDDGMGFPNLGDVIYSTTIPYASLQFFPNYNVVDLSGLNIVLTEDFHVGWSTAGTIDGDTLAGLSDDGSCGAGRSSEWWNGGFSTMLNDWGVDVNFLIFADLCRDEFSQCRTMNYMCNLAYFWRLPDRYGDIGDYQRFSPSGEGCRLEKGRIAFYWPGSEASLPLYTYNSEFQVYGTDQVTGLPDATDKLAGITITPAEYVIYPGLTEVDFTTLPDPILFDSDIWFGVESFAPDTLSGIRTLSDDGSCGSLRSAENYAGAYYYMLDDWGIDINFYMEIDVCCVPFDERICQPGEDWYTIGKDFSRSFASGNSIGDAQGNLTKAWEYVASQVMFQTSPTLYNDTIVGYFLDHLVAIDANTGTEIWKRTADGFEIGSGTYSAPTIYNFADFGMDVTLVFTSGGDTKAFNAINLADGSTWWTRNFMDHNNHFLTWGVCVIIDVGGTPVLIYPDDNGDIYAVNALTGSMYPGWAVNPLNLGGDIFMGLTTDGTNLYVSTDRTSVSGNVFCLDGATGTVIWDLQSSGGLQLANMNPDNAGSEGFTGVISYEVYDNVPTLYAGSYYDVITDPIDDFPWDWGILYCLNATDGSLKWANFSQENNYSGLALDANAVIHCDWPRWREWVGANLRGPTAYSKATGDVLWTRTTVNPFAGDWWMMGGALSCEVEAPDWYITATDEAFVNFHRNTDGAVMFHRRVNPNFQTANRTPPIIGDGKLFLTYRNRLMCLTNQEDRPRLDIYRHEVEASIEFGAPDHYQVVIEDVIGNTGGAPLTINAINLVEDGTIPIQDDAPFRIIDPDRIEDMKVVAKKFARNASSFMKDSEIEGGFVVEAEPEIERNNAAYAIPAWIYGVVSPVPGQEIPPQGSYNDSSNYTDLIIEVDGTQVPRGAVEFYAEIDTDDPDYFLDSALVDGDGDYNKPTIHITLVGGCLYVYDTLSFGVGGNNWWYVWNAPMLGHGDLPNSAEIDGDDVTMWQGSYLFAADRLSSAVPPNKPADIFTPRVAHYTRNWSDVTEQHWMSLLADPNCYDGTCRPNHRTNVLLGSISNDLGASYEPIYGEVIAYAFVDSVEDYCEYDTLGNCTYWDWALGEDQVVPYRDTLTISFKGCVEAIGAVDQPLLNNFIIHRFELGGRYGPVSGISMGAMMDYDLDHPNYSDVMVAGYSGDNSTSWVYNCNWNDVGEGFAWGMVKIPFGCGYDPMVNALSLSAYDGGWNDSAIWLDSANHWMKSIDGVQHQQGTSPISVDPCLPEPEIDGQADREAFFTILRQVDLPAWGSDSYVFAVAQFGLPDQTGDVSDPDHYGPIANTANKWCGFSRGDVNNDNEVNLVDIAYLIDYIYCGGNGPYPFQHSGDVNCDGQVDVDDITRLMDYYFDFGPCLCGEWMLGGYTGP